MTRKELFYLGIEIAKKLRAVAAMQFTDNAGFDREGSGLLLRTGERSQYYFVHILHAPFHIGVGRDNSIRLATIVS